jgi:branched-chain amino acid transport system substrate-binding protein
VPDARTGFDKLVDVDQVPVVMSAMSGVSLALVPVADRRQVVLFANASHPDLTDKSPFVFRNMPSTAKGSTAMADAAARDLRLGTVAILGIDDDYGREARRIFTERFESLGGKVVGAESFDRTATDLRAQLGKLARLKPQGYWMPGYGVPLGLALKQKAELKLPGVVMADLGLVDKDVLDTAGAAAERVVVVSPAFDPDGAEEKVQRFATDYQQTYGEAPSFDAAFQYDAVFLIARALAEAAEPTGPALRDALAAIDDFEGVCGPTSFAEGGSADMPVVVRVLLNGRLAPLAANVAKVLPPKPPAPAPTAPTANTGRE